MPADVAMFILHARSEMDSPQEDEVNDQPRWEHGPDGSKKMSFSTIDGLRAAVKATGGVGFGGAVKVGS
jgi:hypothetical protein